MRSCDMSSDALLLRSKRIEIDELRIVRTGLAVRPFAAVNVMRLEDELLSERVVKTFHVLLADQRPPHSPSSSSSSASSIIVESDWRTERNKLRGMGVFAVPAPREAEFGLRMDFDSPTREEVCPAKCLVV